MTTTPPRRSAASATALGGLVTVVCLLPLFLTGALATLLMADLDFGSAALGFAIAISRATGAAVSPFLGRLTDHLGATLSIRIAALTGAVASVGIALTATRWGILVAWLMVSGAGQALGQPAANRMLSRFTSPGRLGLAFGLKQSAPPAATMLAGLSVPLLALTLGWRWSFGCAALLAVGVAVLTGGVPPRASRQPITARGSRLERRRVVVLLAASFGLGTATSSTITTFYVASSVRAGTSSSFAGTMLAVASIAAIVTRISAGALSDRIRSGHLRLCAAMMAVGAIGLLLLTSDAPTVMAIGAVVGAAGAWGFNGVFWYALVRGYPEFPGQITGTLAPGALLGATIGPAGFGIVVEFFGYPVTWTLAAALSVLAAIVMLIGHRVLPAPPTPSQQS